MINLLKRSGQVHFVRTLGAAVVVLSFWLVLAGGLQAAEVFAWGAGGTNTGSFPHFGQARAPTDLSNVVGLAGGYLHSVALRADGTVVAWGDDGLGQVHVPAGLSNVVAVAAAGAHNLALRADGTVVGWGANAAGQIAIPAGLSNAVAVATGWAHGLALRGDGSLVAWGNNDFGQTTPPPGLSNVIAIAAAGTHNQALRADGTVTGWGHHWRGGQYVPATVPAGLSNVVAIAAGLAHGVAVRRDGTVVSWGTYADGLPMSAPVVYGEVVAVAAGDHHCLALRADGVVIGWGDRTYNQGNSPGRRCVAIGAGGFHSLAVLSRGAESAPPRLLTPGFLVGTLDWPFHHRLRANGHPVTFGATGLPPGLALDSGSGLISGVPENAGTFRVSLTATNSSGATQQEITFVINSPVPAIRSRGVVEAPLGLPFSYTVAVDNRLEGCEATGLPPGLSLESTTGVIAGRPRVEGDFPVSLVASNRHGISQGNFILRVQPLVGWGDTARGQLTLPGGLSNVVALVAGDHHHLALRADGTVVGWSAIRPELAAPPADLTNVVAVAAGSFHSLALRADGTVVGWGDNQSGQAAPPVDLTNAVAIAAGAYHSLALRADGTVAGWGSDWNGQATPPPGLGQVVALAADAYHSYALRADGTLVGWGEKQYWRSLPPAGLSNVTAIAAGWNHYLARLADGTVIGWGNNWRGQATPPPGLDPAVVIAAGSTHSTALLADGRVVSWGSYSAGFQELPMTAPAGLTNVVGIAAGFNHSLALLPGGHLTFRSRSVAPGEAVTLVASIAEGQPAILQWYRDGKPLPGAIGPVLRLGTVPPAQPGWYTAVAEFPFARMPVAAIALLPGAVLRLTTDIAPRIGTVNQQFVLRLRAVNQGPGLAGNVALTCTVAPLLEVLDWRASQGAVQANDRVISAQLDELAEGAGAEVSLTLRALAAGSATNLISVFSAHGLNDQGTAVFSVLAALPALALEVTEIGTSLTWPATAAGFVLEHTDTLTPPVPWARVPDPVVQEEGRYRLGISTSWGTRFFRLAR